MESVEENKAGRLFLWAAVCSCVFQLSWFALKCFHQIDIDGISYLGIARHLRLGEFHAAIDAFRSPLVSWLIAAASFASKDYLRVGKVINIGAFLLSLTLLYVLTLKLWQHRLAASVAVLVFALGRGLLATAVATVVPDFLFAALALVYFMVLLCCLRQDRLQNWFLLGLIHGLAFLAKAFALPWLAVCTVVALGLSNRPWQARLARLACAALIPLLVAASWATVLDSKYGVFTTGVQFRVNLLQWTLRAYDEHHDTTYVLLKDTRAQIDEFGVGDPAPPGSWPWTYPLNVRQLLPQVLRAEEHNLPRVLKELTIVATPGGLIAFVATLIILNRRRQRYPVEWQFAVVVVMATFSLVLAYSMLVFDERYLFPLIPLLLAIGSRFLVFAGDLNHSGWRRLCMALVVLGSIASMVYPASPFRQLTRDFQVSLYDAGNRLRAHPGSGVVSIGSGPYPEHGVGWEAGYKATFFGGRRMVATINALPPQTQMGTLIVDIQKASPDAILVWGRPNDARYSKLTHYLMQEYPQSSGEKISDPVLGEVGIVLFPKI